MKLKKFLLAVFAVVISIIARSQTADEVIANYIKYTGGAQQWHKVKTITSTGTYNYGGMEFPFKSISKAPDLYKYIVTFKGKSFTQSYDGREGWRIDGFKNEKKKTILKGREATALANEADVELESPFINYQQKGHRVVLEGMDSVDKKLCFKIRLTSKNGDESTCFFDSTNFALVKKQTVSKNTELDKSLLDIFYSGYTMYGGIKLPQKIVCVSGGQEILIITIKDVKLNLPVANTLFNP